MAPKGKQVMGLVLLVVGMLSGGASAQSNSCTNALMSLSSCLNYVTGNSSNPSSSCCSSLASVVQSQPRCLCSLLNGNGPNIGVTINQTLALTLPGACSVQTPPISQCNAVANGPASGPISSAISPASSPSSAQTEPSEETPVAAPPANPSAPSIPSGPGSKAVPSTNNNSSNGSKIGGAPIHLLLFVLFMVCCASTAMTS